MNNNLSDNKFCYMCQQDKPRETGFYKGKNKINSKCKECSNKVRVEQRKNKKKSEPHYKVYEVLKGRMKTDFRKYGFELNGKKYGNIIGCNVHKLKPFLENKFVDGMTWDNHGKVWHVDHIVPLGRTLTQDEYERNSHYENLQPLFIKENLSKSDKLEGEESVPVRGKKKITPRYRYRQSMCSVISSSFSRFPQGKNGLSYEEILGIDYAEGLKYFESLFKDGMSWDNRSEWNVDHIVPISFGNTFDEMKYLNHYTNLQPLWRIENSSKSNKIDERNIDLYNKFLMEMREI
jgi:5-methylcytosine-specific restriction endonuclease McrA